MVGASDREIARSESVHHVPVYTHVVAVVVVLDGHVVFAVLDMSLESKVAVVDQIVSTKLKVLS